MRQKICQIRNAVGTHEESRGSHPDAIVRSHFAVLHSRSFGPVILGRINQNLFMNMPIKKMLRNVPFLLDLSYWWRRIKHRSLKRLGAEKTFTKYYVTNFWNDEESVSGSGSNKANTATLVAELRPMLDKLQIGTVLDIPCGDFQWMQNVDLNGIHYFGGDIVREIIDDLEKKFGGQEKTFLHLNLLEGDLPRADVVICRDCLVHFSFEDILHALNAIERSGAKYLATTHFPAARKNYDIVTGDWRRLNFTAQPFGWPQPDESIVENSSEGGGDFADKSLSFWRLDRIAATIKLIR